MTRKSQKHTAAIRPESTPELTLPETPRSAASQDRKLLQEARAALSAIAQHTERAAEPSTAETRNVNALLGLLLLGSVHPTLEGQGLDLLERLNHVAVVTELATDTGAEHDILAVAVGTGTVSRWNLDPAHASIGHDDLARLLRGLHLAARQGVTISRGASNDPLALEDQRLTWLGRKLSHIRPGVIERLASSRPATHPLNSGAGTAEAIEASMPVAVSAVNVLPAVPAPVKGPSDTAAVTGFVRLEAPAPAPVIPVLGSPRRVTERAQTRSVAEQRQPAVADVTVVHTDLTPELEAFGF